MSTRHELTDEQWAVIEPLLPKPKPGPGHLAADPRKTLNGILYVLKTGCTWADMPRQYGSPTTLLAAIETMVGRRDVGADLACAVKSNGCGRRENRMGSSFSGWSICSRQKRGDGMTNYRRLVVRYDRYLHIYRAFCLITFIIWCVNRILK